MATTMAKNQPAATKSDVPEKLEDRVARLIEQADDIAAAAEEILFSTPKDVELSSKQLSVLRVAGFEGDAVDRERARVERVKRALAAAGTPDEFLNARKAFDEAAELERKESTQLQNRISELKQKVADLAAARGAAERRLAGMTTAREKLRSDHLLPKCALDDFNRVRKSELSKLRSRIGAIEAEIGVIDAIQKLDSNSAQALMHAEAIQLSGGPLLIRKTESHVAKVDAGLWSSYVARRRDVDLPRLVRELDGLRPALEEAQAVVAEYRDYYVKRL